ncbi:formate/nitrite transporter family protein [Niveibacterium umoris]|uniref:Nitrite transporter NirC n=1 Tax=Niveibacterium umoris TaxID=1193620 RepID=A0A840BHH3_9RHOO|nr:formate/nitrite transporter family protein [Niveibacterium umoris]MBB4012675.1 nitrite transporter NirC [Niveibacterium umoris]
MIDRTYVEKAAESGVRKLSLLQSDPGRYLTRSVLAGMYLSIVLFVFWNLSHNLHDVSIGKVVASAFFGVGLTIIVFTNAELFTSNNMYLAVSSVEGRTSWGQTVLLWGACYLGNFVGALIVAGLLYGAGALEALPLDHALYSGALHKVHQGAAAIFFKGVLANWVVCLAVRLALRCKEDIAKIAVLILVVFIFLYLGFEHSIANMGTFSMSLLGNGQITISEALFNLVFSTLGNIVGGVLFVGIPFAYINPSEENPPR